MTEEPGDETTAEDAGDAPTPNRRARPTWLLVVVGLIVGAAIGVAAAALVGGDDDEDDSPTLSLVPSDSIYPTDQAAVADRFLDAWRRYREGTFVVELAAERSGTSGEPLRYERVVVQAPGRRLTVQGRSSTYDTAAASVSCEPEGDLNRCATTAGVDFAADLADELAAWRDAFVGTAPPYAIAEPEPGCFELQLVVPLAAAPYGDVTGAYFDADTGALVKRQITSGTGTDTEEATSVRATVTDADWALGAAPSG